MMLTMSENLAAAEVARVQGLKTPEPHSDAFPFVKLPPEIRNMVYRELVLAGCLGWQSAIKRLSKLQAQQTPQKKDRKKERYSTPAILLVSRQIHMEAIQILYSTVFVLPFPASVEKMRRCFGKGFFKQIRYVTLRIDLDKDHSQTVDNHFCLERQEREDTWYNMAKILPLLWSEQHSLRHLRVITTITPAPLSSLRSSLFTRPMMRRIRTFSTLRGIEQVSIEPKELVEDPRRAFPRIVSQLVRLFGFQRP